jgi:transcriptional regulator GlxA family with amidase domain
MTARCSPRPVWPAAWTCRSTSSVAAVARWHPASLARYNVVPPHRDGGQAQFVPADATSHGTAGELAATCEWVLQNLDESLSLADLAANARLSTRTLIRRFETELGTSPKQWLLHARLGRAASCSSLKTTPAATGVPFRVRSLDDPG